MVLVVSSFPPSLFTKPLGTAIISTFFLVLIFFFHHTTCESMCDTLTKSAANQGDNIVLVAPVAVAVPP